MVKKKVTVGKKKVRRTQAGTPITRHGRAQTQYSRAVKRALVIAAVKNEFFSTSAVRYHLNGATPETDSMRSTVMSGALRSARHDGLIEQTDRCVWLHVPGTGRNKTRESVWHSLCYSPGTDDEEEDED